MSEQSEKVKEEIRQERRWHLKAIAVADYHRLQCSKYKNTRNHKWTLLDTSNELKLSCGYISESLKLAKAYKDNLVTSEISREKALELIRNRERMVG